MRAILYVRWTRRYGLRRHEAAARLGITSRTLGAWESEWADDRLAIEPRGRPVARLDRQTRDELTALLYILGPATGVAVLQGVFRDVPRAELEEQLAKFREVFLDDKRIVVHALRWTREGAVWAGDYTTPPEAVDGQYEKILAVRDLASSNQLEALPSPTEAMWITAGVLEAQFRRHGAPLVFKADQGGPMIGQDVQDVLDRWGVWLLMSPGAMPSYNGAIEAGIGSLKTRAHHESARRDRPGQWTCDDVEAARLQGNALGRPRGPYGPTPDQMWRDRRPITSEERAAFGEAVRQYERQLRIDEGWLPDVDLGPRREQDIRRAAIGRVLIALGYLKVRRRRISLGNKLRMWKKIS
jgi:hypothetical protein